MSLNSMDAAADQILSALRTNQSLEGFDLKSLSSDIVLQFGKDIEELDDSTLLTVIKENIQSQNSQRADIQEFAELSLGNNDLGDNSYFLDELTSPSYEHPLSANSKLQNMTLLSSTHLAAPDVPKLNFSQLGNNQVQQHLSPRLPQSQPSLSGLQDHGPTVITTEEEFLSAFWETSFKVFYNICSTSCLTKDCLCIVGELLSLVEHWNRFRSPAILIAIDVVVQRAMYELSDKFIKKQESVDSTTVYSNLDSQKNIEDCISVLSTLAIPLCMKLQNNSWNLQFLDPTNSTYAKMHTLNRQLQELLAWTSLAEQSPIPDSFMEMLRFQVQDGVKLTTPRSMAALEIFDNILLSCINEANNNNCMSLSPQNIEFISNIENKMISLLKRQLSDEIQVKRCGSNVIGTSFFENGVELDYSVLNVLPKPAIGGNELEQSNNNNEVLIKELENIVEAEILYESALKHLRACVKDCSVATNEFLNNLLKPTQDNSQQQHNQHHHNQQQQQQHNNHNSYNNNINSVDVNSRPNMHYIQSLSNSTVLDAEEIRVNGEKFISLNSNYRNDRISSQYPILQLVINKIDNYYDEMEREDKTKTSNLRRIIKSLEKLFRENNNNNNGMTGGGMGGGGGGAGGGNNNNSNGNLFQNVKTITNRLRFIQLKFQSYDQRFRQSIGFTINLDSSLPIQGTELLRNIIKYDSTGKIKLFLNTLKKFVKSHKITDSTNGFLSLFSWYIMGLHVLIKFKYIFYIHGKSYLDSNYSDGNFPNMNIEQKNLQYLCLTQLSRSSIMELLDKFFRYYVEEFDTFKNVISIRNLFHPMDCTPIPLLNKSIWKKNPVLWRLSIEDPCDPIILSNNNDATSPRANSSSTAFDLGSSLSRPGQLTTFKALRRAVYGMRSILLMGIESAKMNMKKLFSKTELIHLARKSDYMGATIPNPKQWIPKSPVKVLSPKDLFKVLQSETIQRLENYDLTIVKRNPSINDFPATVGSSSIDLNSPNGFNVIGNYALPTDRTDFSNRGWNEVTPRQPAYSSMNRVASDNSLAGNIISPRVDPLAISNHSLSGYPLSARLSDNTTTNENNSTNYHNSSNNNANNVGGNEYLSPRGFSQFSQQQNSPQQSQQQQLQQQQPPALPVPAPLPTGSNKLKKGPAIPLLNLGKMPIDQSAQMTSPEMNYPSNNGFTQGLPNVNQGSHWMGNNNSQSEGSIQFPMNSNRSDVFPMQNKFTPRDMVSPLTTARTVDSGEQHNNISNNEGENNSRPPPHPPAHNPLADFDIDINLPLESNPPQAPVNSSTSYHSFQQQQQQQQQQITMPPPGLSMNGLGTMNNSTNMGSWVMNNPSLSTPQQQPLSSQPIQSMLLSSSSNATQQPLSTTLNVSVVAASSSQYSMNYSPSNPHLNSNLVGINSSNSSNSFGLAGHGNGGMMIGEMNNNSNMGGMGRTGYNSGFNSAREPYNNYNNSYNNNNNHNRRRKNPGSNNITPRMNDYHHNNNNNSGLSSLGNDYSNYYSSSASASSSFSSRGGGVGVGSGGMMADLSDPNILSSNYGQQQQQQSYSNPNSARYQEVNQNNNYNNNRPPFQPQHGSNYLPSTGNTSNAGGNGMLFLTPRGSQQQQTFQSQYQHHQQQQQQHHQQQQQQQQHYSSFGNNHNANLGGGNNNLHYQGGLDGVSAAGVGNNNSYYPGNNNNLYLNGPPSHLGNNYTNALPSSNHPLPQQQPQQQLPQQSSYYPQQGWK